MLKEVTPEIPAACGHAACSGVADLCCGCGFGGCGFLFGAGGIFLAGEVAFPPLSLYCFVILLAHISLHCESVSIVYGTMMFNVKWFNIYLILALATVFASGCQSSPEKKKKKELAALHLHMESNPDPLHHTEVASIIRENPFEVTVERTPFLTDANIAEAKVINAMGGFAISIQFNREGQWLLEQYTTANRGRKIAVFCQWGTDLKEHRWLAAPAVSKRISDGLFIFTPDASREEADEIVLGLNNVAKKMHGNWLHDE